MVVIATAAGMPHHRAFQLCFRIVYRSSTMHGRGEKSVQGFGGKARGKETTWKTKA
jgi:hypothetical protein